LLSNPVMESYQFSINEN